MRLQSNASFSYNKELYKIHYLYLVLEKIVYFIMLSFLNWTRRKLWSFFLILINQWFYFVIFLSISLKLQGNTFFRLSKGALVI